MNDIILLLAGKTKVGHLKTEHVPAVGDTVIVPLVDYNGPVKFYTVLERGWQTLGKNVQHVILVVEEKE